MVIPEDLVSLEQAKAHCRVTTTAEDTLLALYVVQATAIVVNYIARASDDDWTAEIEAWNDETVPPQVQAAILLQVAELYRYRGDEEPLKREHGFLSPQVTSLLHRFRDPAVS